nr:MAG: hypothetical protein 3 [Leviviridae sp.]
MKRPTMLLWRVLLDVRLQSLDTIELDYKEICNRYESEGMSFLTITLPRLDDALLSGLARGHLTRSDFIGFKPYKRGGSLPALLQGFFRCIFHIDGSLLDEPDVRAIFAIRQVTRLFKKVELPCSKPRITAAYERYRSNDENVDWLKHRDAFDVSLFTSIAGYLWSDLEELSGELYCFPGKFGSGATGEKLGRNSRLSVTEWPKRSERSFPASFHAVSNCSSSDLEDIRFIDECDERPVRVVQVPKTLKTPRTISVEPSYMMLMQQSIAVPLISYLESKSFGFKSIRFTDQSVNRALACNGSLDGSLATIDLSDASDLVSFDLVREIFEKVAPTFFGLIEDCRSTTALMPDGTKFRLRKYASMGSAMCFPIEAMVFFTIIMYSLVHASGKRPSRALLRKISKRVAVYGDDIIVPSKMAPVVMEHLEDFGLRVNHEKSFHTGLFRESCGGDYYKGVDVTPAYVRQWDDSGTLSNVSQKVAYAALSNIFYMKGMWHACQTLRDHVQGRTLRAIPLSRYPIGALHFCSFVRSDSLEYNVQTHSYRVKGLVPRPLKRADAPGNMSGFLRGSIGSDEYTRAIRSFRRALNMVSSATASSHSTPLFGREGLGDRLRRNPERRRWSEWIWPIGQDLPPHSTSDWFPEGREDSYRIIDNPLPYSQPEVVPGDRTRNFVRVSEPRDLYTSERPYSLCLKSKWTASPAGLEF